MKKKVPCLDCRGQGLISKFNEKSAWLERCPNCGGTGAITVVVTNADIIRRMSDEELAKQLYDMQKQLCIHFAKAVGFPVEELQFQEDAPDILDWLQQPAKEDT